MKRRSLMALSSCILVCCAMPAGAQSSYVLVCCNTPAAVPTTATDGRFIVCKTKKALIAWASGTRASLERIHRSGDCFAFPEGWTIVASDERQEFSIFTVMRPEEKTPINLWTYERIGDD